MDPPTIDTAIEAKAQQSLILEYKKNALQAREAGETNEALTWLKQAKVVQALDSEKLQQLVPFWKQVAVALRENDLEGAKAALLYSKQLESLETSEATSTDEANENAKDHVLATESQPEPVEPETAAEDTKEENTEDIEPTEEDLDLPEITEGGVRFTDAEMMDQEMMVEFQGMGMEVPSQERYAERILHFKKQALQFKQAGDIAKATSQLRNAKQLQAVQGVLQQAASPSVDVEDGDAWLQNLTSEESDLLGELLQDPSEPEHELGAIPGRSEEEAPTSGNQTLLVEDLELMGDDDIHEFIDMGVTIPSAAELMERAAQKQKQAVQCKQTNNIAGAKAALLESKKMKAQAERLARLLQPNDTDSNPENPDDLEALLEGSKPKPKATPPPENPWLKRNPAEIKIEIVRLKNDKKIADATQLLKIYKTVVEREKQAAEAARSKQLVERLGQHIDQAKLQIKLFSFYQRFVKATSGAEQVAMWTAYARQCQVATKMIQTKGSGSVTISQPLQENRLFLLEDDAVSLVESGPAGLELEGALEVTILELLGFEENKTLKKVLQKNKLDGSDRPYLRVHVKLHLPLSDEAVATNLDFEPTGAEKTTLEDSRWSYQFEQSRNVVIPRGDSRPAKSFIRRLESKKAQISVHYYPHDPTKQKNANKEKSWFWKSQPANKTETKEEDGTFLGKAVLELKELLTRNCIAGDFPLQVNNKPVGGGVRICVRTDQAIDPVRYAGATKSSAAISVKPFEDAMSFALVKEPSSTEESK